MVIGDIRPRHYFYIMLIVSLAGMAMLSFVNSMVVNGDIDLSDDQVVKYSTFNRSVSKFDRLQNDVNELKTRSNSSGTTWFDIDNLGVLGSLVKSSWNALTFMWSGPALLSDMLIGEDNVFTLLGLPKWIGSVIVSLVVVMFAFAIFTVIFQREI